MIDIRTDLPAELGPLSWLLGVWEGSGVIDYTIDGKRVSHEFGQRVSFSHDGLPYLNYSSYTWLIGSPLGDADDSAGTEGSAESVQNAEAVDEAEAGESGPQAEPVERPLVSETGYWKLSRTQTEHDTGPGLLPGSGLVAYPTADSVETLRVPPAEGEGFPLEVSLVHPTGVSEVYLGRIAGPRIDLATDYVMRTAGSKEYSAATRMYGLVDGHLLWAWDIAALGQPMKSHASARLAKRD